MATKCVCFMTGVLLLEVCVVKMLNAQQYYGYPESLYGAYGMRARREQVPYRTREDVDRLSEILLNNASDEERPRYKDIARLLRVGRSVDAMTNNRLKRAVDAAQQQPLSARDAIIAPLPFIHQRAVRGAAMYPDSFSNRNDALNRDMLRFSDGR
ncbi:uncharacterized protein LOC129595671 [Paramacrobiotus metropolitanus]|uniref:uncharacterized protein LOC129595671 n=1 Tax=Paramacrobiotus metropolitanus TaxID=2943436 RepID=UPI002445F50E|nr:uncharacterized protein LOC129595671 [Paramacrobiotus metropolitanus]